MLQSEFDIATTEAALEVEKEMKRQLESDKRGVEEAVFLELQRLQDEHSRAKEQISQLEVERLNKQFLVANMSRALKISSEGDDVMWSQNEINRSMDRAAMRECLHRFSWACTHAKRLHKM